MARLCPSLSFAALPLRGLALGAYASVRVLPRVFRTSCSDGLDGSGVSSVLQAASPPQVFARRVRRDWSQEHGK